MGMRRGYWGASCVSGRLLWKGTAEPRSACPVAGRAREQRCRDVTTRSLAGVASVQARPRRRPRCLEARSLPLGPKLETGRLQLGFVWKQRCAAASGAGWGAQAGRERPEGLCPFAVLAGAGLGGGRRRAPGFQACGEPGEARAFEGTFQWSGLDWRRVCGVSWEGVSWERSGPGAEGGRRGAETASPLWLGRESGRVS